MTKAKELPWRRWIESVEAFVKAAPRGGPRWAVFCTYDFAPDRFISDVLPALQGRGRGFNVVVLADASRFQLLPASALYRGARYNLHPVRLGGGGFRAFHPKLAFLRVGDHVHVGWGSANLTDGGLGGNLELWATTDEPELAAAATAFLFSLAERSTSAKAKVHLDPAGRRAIARAVCGLPTQSSPRFWSSMQSSFSTHLKRKDAGLLKATSVHVLSPAYTTPEGLSAAVAVFRHRVRRLNTDGYVSLPGSTIRLYRGDGMTRDGHVSAADPDAKGLPRLPSRLHAKAYLLANARGGALWTGSANFTCQALARSADKAGNIEILVRSDLDQYEADAWLRELNNRTLFRAPSKDDQAQLEKPPERDSGPAKGVILSAEWTDGNRLVFHSTSNRATATVEIAGRAYRLRFQRGRAELKGVTLLRDLDRHGTVWNTSIVELVGRTRVPVIVNVPLVAERTPGSTGVEDLLDGHLDEILGRLPPITVVGEQSEDVDEEQQADEAVDEALDDTTKKLDEVRHQGLLDRVAVKAALLKRHSAGGPGSRALLQTFMNDLTNVVEDRDRHILAFIRATLRVSP